jgi:XTP/dITP diphosphohydrolase
MRVLCLSTRNHHKLEEVAAILEALGVRATLRSCDDFPHCPEVVEDGATLEANATKKARELCACTGLVTLADDTGLEVDALGGAPGVISARWAGPGCTFADNIAKLLRELRDVPEERRTARFRCCIALASPATPGEVTRVQLFEGRIEGRITMAARGQGGFGYDSVFLVEGERRTLAELSLAAKNSLSHRARALAAAREAIVLDLSAQA